MLIFLLHLYLGNFIPGLDFNPAGELIATIDRYGVCLISDVNTNKYSFHTDMKMSVSWGGNYENL